MILVRGGVEEYLEPRVFTTSKARDFVRRGLNILEQQLAYKLESFVVGGMGGKYQFIAS